MFVGGRPQRSQHLLSGNSIDVLHTVSTSIDIRVTCLKVLADGDTSGRPDGQPGILGKAHIWPCTKRQQHQPGVKFDVPGDNLAYPSILIALKPDDTLSEQELHAFIPQMFSNMSRNVKIEQCRQDPVQGFEHSDI